MIKKIELSFALCTVAAMFGSDSADRASVDHMLNWAGKSVEEKKDIANSRILRGTLQGALVNGRLQDFIGGPLTGLKRGYQVAMVNALLEHGDTVTASPRMLDKTRCMNGYLNLQNMGLVTVRDIAPKDFFESVTHIDLSYNQLNEIPAAFFRMFPKLQKINISNNPITHLDTTSMPYGLVVVAKDIPLQSILGTNLATQALTFNIYNTPLAQNAGELKRLRAACTAYYKNPLFRCVDRCCGQDPDEQPDTSSTINT